MSGNFDENSYMDRLELFYDAFDQTVGRTLRCDTPTPTRTDHCHSLASLEMELLISTSYAVFHGVNDVTTLCIQSFKICDVIWTHVPSVVH